MTAIAHQPHPVTRAVAGVRAQLSDVAEVPLTPSWSAHPTTPEPTTSATTWTSSPPASTASPGDS